MNRRAAITKLLGALGAGAIAPKSVGPQDLRAMAKVLPRQAEPSCGEVTSTGSFGPEAQAFQYMLDADYRAAHAADTGMHPSIKSKKSWSLAFKVHAQLQRNDEIEHLRRRFYSDSAFAEKVCKLLGG